jgi:formamidopyrimidine-DNA glycosylase
VPELPEVETVARDLDARLPGRTIERVTVLWPRTVQRPALDAFCARLAGRTVQHVGRRGKFVVIALDQGDRLLVHLRMTGRLLIEPADAPAGPHTRVVFALDRGERLRFDDARKFGRMLLLHPAEFGAFSAALGAEPLDAALDLPAFARLLDRRARVKALLLDQRSLAGVGNIYADEALFRAGVHPARAACTLTPAELERLYGALRAVLATGVDYRGTSTSTYLDALGQRGRFQERLLVYRRAGQPCSRCGTSLARAVVGGRTSTFCPRCQPLVP